MTGRLNSTKTWPVHELAAISLLVLLVAGCGSTYKSVGICQGLQTDTVNDRLVAICWSDETAIASAVSRSELLGPSYSTVNELLDAFADERGTLQLRGTGKERELSGFRYQLSHPQIVSERKQYNLEVSLPTAIDAQAVQGPTKDVIEFVKQKNGSSRKVDVEFLPVADSKLSTVSLHLEDWKIKAITVEQYVAK